MSYGCGKKGGEILKKLKHNGMVYSIALESGDLAFVFQNEEDAVNYCKDKYPNTNFQILPIPVFKFIQEKGDD